MSADDDRMQWERRPKFRKGTRAFEREMERRRQEAAMRKLRREEAHRRRVEVGKRRREERERYEQELEGQFVADMNARGEDVEDWYRVDYSKAFDMWCRRNGHEPP